MPETTQAAATGPCCRRLSGIIILGLLLSVLAADAQAFFCFNFGGGSSARSGLGLRRGPPPPPIYPQSPYYAPRPYYPFAAGGAPYWMVPPGQSTTVTPTTPVKSE